jgi:hypothetical protein
MNESISFSIKTKTCPILVFILNPLWFRTGAVLILKCFFYYIIHVIYAWTFLLNQFIYLKNHIISLDYLSKFKLKHVVLTFYNELL